MSEIWEKQISAGFVASHPSPPHPGQSRRQQGNREQEEQGRGAERRQQLDGTDNFESFFTESFNSYTDFSMQGRIQDLLQQEHEATVRAAVRDQLHSRAVRPFRPCAGSRQSSSSLAIKQV